MSGDYKSAWLYAQDCAQAVSNARERERVAWIELERVRLEAERAQLSYQAAIRDLNHFFLQKGPMR
jgi:hypothetical protein